MKPINKYQSINNLSATAIGYSIEHYEKPDSVRPAAYNKVQDGASPKIQKAIIIGDSRQGLRSRPHCV